jgi:hypothetical protein
MISAAHFTAGPPHGTIARYGTMARPILTALATAVVAFVMSAGCAHAPPQSLTTQLARTDSSIAQAEQSGAPQGGLPELQLAKDKRARAQEALVRRNYDASMQLAQQAQVDAQFASLKAQRDRAMDSAAEVERSNQTLRNETRRNATPQS